MGSKHVRGENRFLQVSTKHKSHKRPMPRGDAELGPASLLEILQTLPDMAASLERNCPAVGHVFAQALHTGLVMTSSYSGLGTAEVAGLMLADGFLESAKALGRQAGVRTYSAADISPEMREVLKLHHVVGEAESQSPWRLPANAGIEHIFGDIIDRCDSKTASALRALNAATFEEVANGVRPAASGEAVVSRLTEIFAQASWHKSVPCFVHEGQRCEVLPDRAERIHLEVAGVTCVAWSNMNHGQHQRWYHPSATPCLAHAHWCRWAQPSIILIECVRGFDASTYLHVLSADHMYFSEQICFSPLDLGIPTSRGRRFTIAWRTDEFSQIKSLSPEKMFDRLHRRRLQCTAKAYMIATASKLQSLKSDMLQAKFVVL